MRTLMMLLFFALSNGTSAAEKTPEDVQAYIRNAEACEYFAGEFDGDSSAARKKEIERSVVKYCQRAQRQLEKLKMQYKSDSRVTDIIRTHTNESVTSFR